MDAPDKVTEAEAIVTVVVLEFGAPLVQLEPTSQSPLAAVKLVVCARTEETARTANPSIAAQLANGRIEGKRDGASMVAGIEGL